jgi:hypothetical protein
MIVDKEKEKIVEELEAYAEGVFGCTIEHPASGVGDRMQSRKYIYLFCGKKCFVFNDSVFFGKSVEK